MKRQGKDAASRGGLQTKVADCRPQLRWCVALVWLASLAVFGGGVELGAALSGPADLVANSVDGDGDGLTDWAERGQYGTNSTTPDSDGDGFTDREEVRGATTDGVRLPGADPTRKDLYVVVHDAKGITPLTARERTDLRRIFRAMPVSNPDGTRGIRLHVNPSFAGGYEPAINTTFETRHDANRATRYYAAADRYRCVAHQVLLVDIDNRSVKGWGDAPGYQALVDGTNVRPRGSAYTERTVSIVHELLHNVVGNLGDGRAHTDDGWLNDEGTSRDESLYMATETRQTLNERGFADRSKFIACRGAS